MSRGSVKKIASGELIHAIQRHAQEVRNAAEARARIERLEATVETLASDLESRERGGVVGVSSSWKETLRQVGRVASADTTVLVTGESGTGKEVISSLIHRNSPRAGKLFLAINCAALPEQLLESELFGHEKGAFTGVIAAKIGRIEQAAGGTLFLDEIAELSPRMQGQVPAGTGAAGVPAAGGKPDPEGGRASDRRHEPGPDGGHGAPGVSRRPLLSAERLPDHPRAAAEAP
jgi:transcriptional regulator with GAF, ATPase, and Fis domain